MSETVASPELRDPYVGRYTDEYTTINGLRLHYTDWGGSSDRPLLMVHGLNVQLHTWDPVADLLREEFRIICLDLRGHGDSDWAKEGYPVKAFVSDIYELVQQLGLGPVDYVGHSLGSRIGIAVGGEHPEILRRLVLSDTGPEVSRDAALKVRDRSAKVSNVRGFRDEAEAFAYMKDRDPEWQSIFHELQVKYQLRRNWAGKLVFKADPELFWINGSASVREVPYLWEMAARIPVRVLIMRGERSPILSEEIAQRMLQVIPRAELEVFDTGHAIPREQPEEFVRVLRRFLNA